MKQFSKEEIASRKEHHGRCSMLLITMSLNSGSDRPEIQEHFNNAQAEYMRLTGEQRAVDASMHTMD